MRGIETAFWGTLGKDVELKTSKNGTHYTSMNVVVTVGKSDDGDVSQWVRVACFGETAERIAARAKKGDRVYVEGTLTMNQWNDAQGEVKHGLNVAAWTAERLSSIGKNRERKPGTYQENGMVPPKQDNQAQHADFIDEIPF